MNAAPQAKNGRSLGSGAGGSSDLTLPIVVAAIVQLAGLAGLLLVLLRRCRPAAEE